MRSFYDSISAHKVSSLRYTDLPTTIHSALCPFLGILIDPSVLVMYVVDRDMLLSSSFKEEIHTPPRELPKAKSYYLS